MSYHGQDIEDKELRSLLTDDRIYQSFVASSAALQKAAEAALVAAPGRARIDELEELMREYWAQRAKFNKQYLSRISASGSPLVHSYAAALTQGDAADALCRQARQHHGRNTPLTAGG